MPEGEREVAQLKTVEVQGRIYRLTPYDQVPGRQKGDSPCEDCAGGRSDKLCIELGDCTGGVFLEVAPEPPNPAPGGLKFDDNKPPLQLLDGLWLTGVAQVLAFGAVKYAPHNWRKGLQLSRLLGAALRHIFAFLGGQDKDPETGLSHLYHASCCLMFAANMHETRPDMDDRFKPETPQ